MDKLKSCLNLGASKPYFLIRFPVVIKAIRMDEIFSHVPSVTSKLKKNVINKKQMND